MMSSYWLTEVCDYSKLSHFLLNVVGCQIGSSSSVAQTSDKNYSEAPQIPATLRRSRRTTMALRHTTGESWDSND